MADWQFHTKLGMIKAGPAAASEIASGSLLAYICESFSCHEGKVGYIVQTRYVKVKRRTKHYR